MIVEMQIYKDLEVADNLSNTMSQIDNEILNTLVLASEELAKYIVEQKLSGQVLNRRSGKLQESISAHEASRQSFQYTMIVSQDEEIAPYGPIHEHGGHVPERIGNPIMHWTSPEGNEIFTRRARAYDMPQRSFMRTALEENDARIQDLMKEVVDRVVKTNWGM